nr:hypothetical protein [Tanacetum cinerariifolium]
VNSGPLLEFYRTLMMGMRLCFNRLTSRSITSTGSSTKQSLSSMCTSSNEIPMARQTNTSLDWTRETCCELCLTVQEV